MKRQALAVLAALSMSACAQAQLGQSSGSAATSVDAATAPAMLRQGAAWTESSTTNAQGVTIEQFVNGGGTVFAVSWSGPVKPDLKQLLGTYFAQMPSGLGNVVQSGGNASDLVVYSSGFMPHFQGYAYLKSLTPAGFSFPKR